MHLHIHCHNIREGEIVHLLAEIRELLIHNNKKINTLMSNTDQALADLAAIGTTLSKISVESSASLAKITELEQAANDAGVPQSVLDAIAAVKAQAENIDALVPDAPTTEPTI